MILHGYRPESQISMNFLMVIISIEDSTKTLQSSKVFVLWMGSIMRLSVQVENALILNILNIVYDLSNFTLHSQHVV